MTTRTETRTRSTAVRAVAVLFVLIATLALMGLIDLFTLLGWVDQTYVWEVPLEASWGALFTFFVAGAYVWVGLFPHAPWPGLAQLGITGLALLLSAPAGRDWRPSVVALGVAGSAAVLWQLTGRPPVSFVGRLSLHRAALTIALLGVPLWLPYALTAFRRSRAGELGSVTQGIEHWPVQGAVAVALVVAALVLALWDDGRPLLRVAVSLSAVYIGMAELAYPDRGGAMGSTLWGVGVTLWGLLIALVALPRRVPETR